MPLPEITSPIETACVPFHKFQFVALLSYNIVGGGALDAPKKPCETRKNGTSRGPSPTGCDLISCFLS